MARKTIAALAAIPRPSQQPHLARLSISLYPRSRSTFQRVAVDRPREAQVARGVLIGARCMAHVQGAVEVADFSRKLEASVGSRRDRPTFQIDRDDRHHRVGMDG